MSISRTNSSLSLLSSRNSSSSDDDSLSSSGINDSDSSAPFYRNMGVKKRHFEDTTTLSGEIQLKIIRQPEEQHRARYMSEGSRGAIKDRSGKSHCAVQLIGYGRPTSLQVYAATERDPLEPHQLYRTIPVTGKGSPTLTTPCKEHRTQDGTHAVELLLRPEHKMIALLDCVGILKVCSHDVRRKLSRNAKGASIRLVFRAKIPDPLNPTRDLLLQTVSDPISCVQQLGFPEIQRMSFSSERARGGSDLFIIGRNFDKNTTVIFREYNSEGRLVWTSEADMDRKFLHACHLVCSVPTYRDLNIAAPVEITVVVECGKKTSHSHPFTYKPDSNKSEVSDTAPCLDQQKFQPDWSAVDYSNTVNMPATLSYDSLGNVYGGDCRQMSTNSCQDSPPRIPSPNLSSIIEMLESSNDAASAPQITYSGMNYYSDSCTDYSSGPPAKQMTIEMESNDQKAPFLVDY